MSTSVAARRPLYVPLHACLPCSPNKWQTHQQRIDFHTCRLDHSKADKHTFRILLDSMTSFPYNLTTRRARRHTGKHVWQGQNSHLYTTHTHTHTCTSKCGYSFRSSLPCLALNLRPVPTHSARCPTYHSASDGDITHHHIATSPPRHTQRTCSPLPPAAE